MRLLLLLLLFAGGGAAAQTVRFTDSATIDGVRFPIPMAIHLRAETETELILTLQGDLGAIQRNMPALLSQELEDGCSGRSAIAVTEAVAEGENIRLFGQLQTRRYLCVGGSRGAELLRQTAEVEVLLAGGMVGECLVMRVRTAAVRPDGVTGGVLNVTGLSQTITRRLGESLDKALRDGDNCIDIPEEFQAFDARITGGGFREIGEGGLGAEIHGTLTINTTNFIELMGILEEKGRLGD